MGVFELPIVTNNKQKRTNESLQYKKYYIFKYLHLQEDTNDHGLKRTKQIKKFRRTLKYFRKRYVQYFDRPQDAYEEWYPKQVIEESNEDGNSNEDVRTANDEMVVNEPADKHIIDLTSHRFNHWNHYSYIKDLKKKNKSILLATTKKQHLEAYDKAFLRKTRKHYKTRHFLTDYSEKSIIENSFKLLNVSNVMQIWHMSIFDKNWKRAYQCMAIIIRIENIEIKQIYSLIIVTLQNCREQDENDNWDKDTLLNFLKWVTFKNSPLIRIHLSRTQTDKFPFFNRIKTFSSIPHVIYFYCFYSILLHYKKFMETLNKKDIVLFKQFLISLEEMMLVPPFQDDFIFNYFLALSYMILVDLNGILLDSQNCGNKESILREVNLNLNNSVKIFKQLGISTELNKDKNTPDNNEKQTTNNNHSKQTIPIYYYNEKFISEQLDFLKNKIFGTGSDLEQSSNSDIDSDISSIIKTALDDEEDCMKQESLLFDNMDAFSTQQSQDNNQADQS